MLATVSPPDAPNPYNMEDPDNVWPHSNAEDIPQTAPPPSQQVGISPGTRLHSSDSTLLLDLSIEEEGRGRRRDTYRKYRSRTTDTISPHHAADHESVRCL